MNIFAGFVASSVLLIVLLAMNVSRVRIKYQVANGDAGNKAIKSAIRAHMNTFEHTLPFALLLLS